MTTERRLDRLEAELPPKEGVLLWLEEAHEHGSLPAYCRWLVDRPAAEAPLPRLDLQTLGTVRQRHRGATNKEVFAALWQAERDVAFFFELVLVLNASAERMLELGGLRYGILFWERRAIRAEMLEEGLDPGHGAATERWARWQSAVSALRMDLRVEDEARSHLEAGYLDGRVVLFPDTLECWTRLLCAADGLASLDGSDALGVPRPDPGRVREAAGRLVGWAQARALDILGGHEDAGAIVGRWLRDDGVHKEDP